MQVDERTRLVAELRELVVFEPGIEYFNSRFCAEEEVFAQVDFGGSTFANELEEQIVAELSALIPSRHFVHA